MKASLGTYPSGAVSRLPGVKSMVILVAGFTKLDV